MSGIDQDLAAQAVHLRNQFTLAQLAQLTRLIGPVPDTGLMTAEKFERVMALMAGQYRRRGGREVYSGCPVGPVPDCVNLNLAY